MEVAHDVVEHLLRVVNEVHLVDRQNDVFDAEERNEECVAANKIKGIRAALCSDCFSAQATKEHNNANVLCMGARVIGPELAFRIADTFLDSKFSNDERHIRRISMLED